MPGEREITQNGKFRLLLLADVFFCGFVNGVFHLKARKKLPPVRLAINQVAHEGGVPPFHFDRGAHGQLFLQDQAETMNREIRQARFGGLARDIRTCYFYREVGSKARSIPPVHARPIG